MERPSPVPASHTWATVTQGSKARSYLEDLRHQDHESGQDDAVTNHLGQGGGEGGRRSRKEE